MEPFNQGNTPFKRLTGYIYFLDRGLLNCLGEDSAGEELSESIPLEKDYPQGSRCHNNVSKEISNGNGAEEEILPDRKNPDLDDKGDNKTPPVQL